MIEDAEVTEKVESVVRRIGLVIVEDYAAVSFPTVSGFLDAGREIEFRLKVEDGRRFRRGCRRSGFVGRGIPPGEVPRGESAEKTGEVVAVDRDLERDGEIEFDIIHSFILHE